MLLPDGLHANALAVDWPWKRQGERRLTRWQFITAIPEIHEALMRSPATLALGVDAVIAQPEADPGRIALVGASLGVPTTLAAFELTSVPSAAALVHGAADIRAWMTHEVLRRRVHASVVPAFTSMAFELTRGLEPTLHRDAASRARMLILNAREDQFVPVRLAETLQALFPQAIVRWKEGRHVAGRHASSVLDALAVEIDYWLNEQ
jgi:dienelactone hydrolase